MDRYLVGVSLYLKLRLECEDHTLFKTRTINVDFLIECALINFLTVREHLHTAFDTKKISKTKSITIPITILIVSTMNNRND